ncbi:hypothetical protein Mal64_33280 [Pseudobythopirellula maris]|uniref:Probable pectate lyase C n=1 Tax=Pseudobythopirellula maris TaxID=2527991 RepID=A0A5C5ZGN5_9BACT|nr:hypothetical protein [Pseudobythopirellula maris]TWT86502.1 hypothetical protein Mal64_33280 [Pseudobythopirellula maris]
MRIALIALVLSAQSVAAFAQPIPAFPGAEGAGAFATGGRPNDQGGIVYHVTTLDPDPTGEIPGSLRYGLNSDNFTTIRESWPWPWYNVDIPDSYDVTPRLIVFDVGGTIDIGEVDITPMNVTIAGQTAPGGITLYGGEFNPGHRDPWDEGTPPKVNNLVLRNFSVRTHDPAEKDGIWLAASNSIADHLSLAWYTDEGVSITDSARDVTVQHSIVGPGWRNPDGDGSQLEGKTPGGHISVHHNLYVHNDARVPRLGEKEGPGIEVDFRNNVIYNVNDNKFGYSGEDEPSFTNFVNNYYIGGYNNGPNDGLFRGSDSLTHLYQDGNVADLNKNGVADGSNNVGYKFGWNETQHATPFDVPHGVTQTAEEALETVRNYAGARWWDRDFLDQRSLDQLATFGQGSAAVAGSVLFTIDPDDVAAVTGAPMQTRPAGWDTDNDGMPNHWESERGLDPMVADWDQDDDADGYINLEEYINELAAWPAPNDIRWQGGEARFAEILNWGITRPNPGEAPTTTNWQPSRFDRAVIASGVATVDAPGQHAGTVVIGEQAGDDATLRITDGWLKVEDEAAGPGDGVVAIGADDAAAATLSLSGGRLIAKRLTRGASGAFSMTGGVLSAEEVAFDLVNNGGAIAPGEGIGATEVLGDALLASGSLAIDLASASENDLLSVTGELTLGGDLLVSLLDGFAPASGSWTIAHAASISGGFGAVTPGFAVSVEGNDLVLSVAADLPGDYNGNGVVDAADFTVWRDGLGAEYDQSDYDVWVQNFGMTAQDFAEASSHTVPEPSGLFTLAVLFGLSRRRRP